MNENTKKLTWNTRLAHVEKQRIVKLAERLQVSESEAVRRAVLYSLAKMPKTVKKLDGN